MRSSFMPTKAVLIAALLGAAVLSAPAQAQIVNNGTPDNSNGLYVASGVIFADNFTLASNSSLTAFNWWALAGNGGLPGTTSASYTVQVYGNGGSAPSGSALASYSIVNGSGTLTNYGCCSGSATGTDTYRDYAFSANLGGLSLGAGSYWIAVTDLSGADIFPYWATSNAYAGDNVVSLDGGLTWTGYDSEMAFTIEGAEEVAPEPASLVLLATGLVGVAAAARRKKANKA